MAEGRYKDDHEPYTVLEQPLDTTRHVRIITIGAGASGINMIRTLRKTLSNCENVVYEKIPDIGGTWYENRYPGCQCDIPSHNYQFSWAPNPRWSRFYSETSEIHGYFKDLVVREDLGDAIKLRHQVEHAEWDEDKGQWRVRVRDLNTDTVIKVVAHFLLDGSGILNNCKWPDIPGLHTFKGDLVHSASWPTDWDYKGKRVAVVGNGLSGVQIVPAISPIWVALSGLQGTSTSTAGEVFDQDKTLYKRFVKAIEEVMNNKFNFGVVKEQLSSYMANALKGDKKLIDMLVPDFPLGYRRITPSVSYLNALHEDNMHLVTDPITEIFETGFKTQSGEIIHVDAIVCATGFDVSFRPRFPILGRSGENLQDIWTEQPPSSYMSCAVPGMPNYFTFLGPNAPIGHGRVLTITEHAAKYITRLIHKCQEEGIKSVTPRQEAVNDLNEHIATFMPRTAWAGTCRSWFKNGEQDGPVTALHPGSRIHRFHMMQNFRGEDFEYTHWAGNRFRYLGNGYSTLKGAGMNSTW
ncbi:FAD/NAD(P)-binding domain-containing protein [Aspergillus cavernicola]|uniref:FAD/NAD(P)-binding domain-containing protein n=1 Tax=Aspergillus cavernicola TaxID=176166 RepID=A0ABR4IKT5_9EURO